MEIDKYKLNIIVLYFNIKKKKKLISSFCIVFLFIIIIIFILLICKNQHNNLDIYNIIYNSCKLYIKKKVIY